MVPMPNASPDSDTPFLSQGEASAPIDLEKSPPDPFLIQAMGPDLCLKHVAVPVAHFGGGTVMATRDGLMSKSLKRAIPPDFGPVVLRKASEAAIQGAVIANCSGLLVARAEARVAEHESCRFWYDGGPRRRLLQILLVAVIFVALSPVWAFALAFAWVMLCQVAVTGLKIAALLAPPARARPVIATGQVQVPRISVMVPLLRETDILPRLIGRLSKLKYPKDRLDVCLVTEGNDMDTRRMLIKAALPDWMRVITVPAGQLQTKPRALNYALDMCKGDIIGIWDAEDAPEPDQLLKVAHHFATCDPKVACLQGALDYYNSRQNWLTRCFTVEYASWWRVVLPGICRLGLVLPLGGTSLFLRRDVVERLDRWDAHNVTEDADLGIRLARHGYRTEIIPTATHEEATSKPVPWVRQRSRWLKGFMMTWATHMRFPGLLRQQLGWKRFMGIQVLFLCTLSQVILAPLAWSLWLVALGVAHPLQPLVGDDAMRLVFGIFLATEASTLLIGALGVLRAKKAWLIPWIPTLHLYFPLATLAAYKAMLELFFHPFYWDKTQHGRSGDHGSLA